MIRIRRASLRLVGDGFATVGEAASMVVPMGASGVTSGMLAGRALGQHLGQVLKRGGLVSTKDLWPWCAAYQRGRGAVLASYDANRRVLETLDPQRELETLATSGVMTGEDMQRTFLVLPLRQSFSTLGARLRGGLRNPLLMAKLAPGFFRVMQVEAYWRRFPLRWDEPAFVAWKKTAERLLP
jgi:flavin-dependent dehydrogenase